MAETELIWRTFTHDPKVSEILKRLGPTFPYPGPHYDYADLIEHIRYSLSYMASCEVNHLFDYHLPEIYKRKKRLLEEIAKARDAGVITGKEHEYILKHITDVLDRWQNKMEEYFKKCVRKTVIGSLLKWRFRDFLARKLL